MVNYTYKYDMNLNKLYIYAGDAVYEEYDINPQTLNGWFCEAEANAFGNNRIMQLYATAPLGEPMELKLSIIEKESSTLTTIIKKGVTYLLQFEALTKSGDLVSIVDFDHKGVLLECNKEGSTDSADIKLYLIPFVDGVGKVDITFDTSGVYRFELDSLRDSITKELLTDIYKNINKSEDLLIAVTDN